MLDYTADKAREDSALATNIDSRLEEVLQGIKYQASLGFYEYVDKNHISHKLAQRLTDLGYTVDTRLITYIQWSKD